METRISVARSGVSAYLFEHRLSRKGGDEVAMSTVGLGVLSGYAKRNRVGVRYGTWGGVRTSTVFARSVLRCVYNTKIGKK